MVKNDGDVVLRLIGLPHKRKSKRCFSQTYVIARGRGYRIDSMRFSAAVPALAYTHMQPMTHPLTMSPMR